MQNGMRLVLDGGLGSRMKGLRYVRRAVRSGSCFLCNILLLRHT